MITVDDHAQMKVRELTSLSLNARVPLGIALVDMLEEGGALCS
jgi:hypothetical protein